jgi:hypothetical protein
MVCAKGRLTGALRRLEEDRRMAQRSANWERSTYAHPVTGSAERRAGIDRTVGKDGRRWSPGHAADRVGTGVIGVT